MRTAQQGDRVHIHYVKRAQNGAMCSSQGREPLELTVGTEHRRLPGLGQALVGLGEGERVTVLVPAEQAYGLPSADRVRRLARSRFPKGGQSLRTGSWVHVTGRTGRRRLVRIQEVRDKVVVVDTNHPWAGQAMALEVELIRIQSPESAKPADGASG